MTEKMIIQVSCKRYSLIKIKRMKDRIQTGAIIIMMIMMNANANGRNQSFSHEITPYGYTAHDGMIQVMAPSIIGDSLLQLQKNYPPVYNHLLQQFKNAASLYYSVHGNILLISFTSNNQKILTVYSTAGEFRHSITDIGFALPHAITEQLNKGYPSYSVYYGKEIRANNKSVYQVVIENKDEYRLINFLDTEMEEVKRIKK
jgi:hypothetical protein